MADFSLQDLWWLKPKEQDNPLPALQLGVQIAQNKAKMDLAERDLANDVARTSLMREEMLAKQKIQTMLVAGNAEMASAISEVNDWTDEEQVSKVWSVGARNPMTVGSKAWLGAQHMVESARTAKRLEGEARSRIASRTVRDDLAQLDAERKDLLADSTIDLNDDRILDNNARRAIATARLALDEKKFALQEMMGNSRMNVDDATVAEKQQDIDLAERKLLIQEGNLALRKEEIGQKWRRLDARAQASYNNELKALNEEEKAKLKALSPTSDEASLVRKTANLKRRAITEKFYGDEAKTPRTGIQTDPTRGTNQPPAMVAPPMTNAPMDKNVQADKIRESFRAGTITKEEAMTLLQGLGFK